MTPTTVTLATCTPSGASWSCSTVTAARRADFPSVSEACSGSGTSPGPPPVTRSVPVPALRMAGVKTCAAVTAPTASTASASSRYRGAAREELVGRHQGGVVDHDVRRGAAGDLLQRRPEALDVRGVGDGDGDVGTGGAQLRRQLLQRVGAPGDQRHRRALAGEPPRHRGTEAGPGADDDDAARGWRGRGRGWDRGHPSSLGGLHRPGEMSSSGVP
ncbi:MAG: hypothetical protein PGN11_01985 [Quadrisphaera sp.]